MIFIKFVYNVKFINFSMLTNTLISQLNVHSYVNLSDHVNFQSLVGMLGLNENYQNFKFISS